MDTPKPIKPKRQTISGNVYYTYDDITEEVFLYNETLVNLSAILPILKQEIVNSRIGKIFSTPEHHKQISKTLTACLGRTLRLSELCWNPNNDIFCNSFIIIRNTDTSPIFVDLSRMAIESGKPEKDFISTEWKKIHKTVIPLLTNWSIRTYFTGKANKQSDKILSRGSVVQTLELIFYIDRQLLNEK